MESKKDKCFFYPRLEEKTWDSGTGIRSKKTTSIKMVKEDSVRPVLPIKPHFSLKKPSRLPKSFQRFLLHFYKIHIEVPKLSILYLLGKNKIQISLPAEKHFCYQ